MCVSQLKVSRQDRSPGKYMEWFHGMVTISNTRGTPIENSLLSGSFLINCSLFCFQERKEHTRVEEREKGSEQERIIEIDREIDRERERERKREREREESSTLASKRGKKEVRERES